MITVIGFDYGNTCKGSTNGCDDTIFQDPYTQQQWDSATVVWRIRVRNEFDLDILSPGHSFIFNQEDNIWFQLISNGDTARLLVESLADSNIPASLKLVKSINGKYYRDRFFDYSIDTIGSQLLDLEKVNTVVLNNPYNA